ncbi:hypothetical protein ES288_A05G391000v1 [Gossypium darwinii]|uniref:Uncharacterized protein n=1 Tax=Gossypium darwinii TaxID=34276 RepID=A0A5D2GRV9_GOSDA|nr:hypothetical protein ES288_A05G391000v1 [Gossypium darwinii]
MPIKGTCEKSGGDEGWCTLMALIGELDRRSPNLLEPVAARGERTLADNFSFRPTRWYPGKWV